MKKAVFLLALLMTVILSSCVYMPGNMPFTVYVYSNTEKTRPVEGLRCAIKKHSDLSTEVTFGFTDSEGRYSGYIELDDPWNKISHEDFYSWYVIEITDVDGDLNEGHFEPYFFQPKGFSSAFEEDRKITLTLKTVQ